MRIASILSLYLLLALGLPWAVYTDHVVYVPIEIKTCTNCTDKVISTPPNRVSDDGKHGFIQVLAAQVSAAPVSLHTSTEGFAALLKDMPSQPVKTIDAPCVCASVHANKFSAQLTPFNFVQGTTNSLRLPDMVQWYNSRLILSMYPQGSVINSPTGRAVQGIVQLLPGNDRSGQQATNSQKQNSANNAYSTIAILDAFDAFIADSASASNKPKITAPPDVKNKTTPPTTSQKNPTPEYPVVIDMVNEPIILDIRPTYIPLHVIQNMKNLSPQEQLALLYEHNVATGKADQSWSGFSSIVIPSTTANQPPLIKNISLSVNGHKAHFGTGGSGFGIHFSLNQKSAQQAANEQRARTIRAENIDWEIYRLYPKDFDANFFIERVAYEEGYSNGVPVDALFERHDLYEHDTYLDLLKILPNYDQKILTLHHTVNNKKKHFDRSLELKRYHIWQEDSPANREKTSLATIKKIKFSQLINHLAGEIEKRHEQTRQLAQALLNEELEKQFQAKLAQKIATEQARFVQTMRAEKQALTTVIHDQQKNIHSKKTEPVDSIFENHYREQDFERFIKQQPLTLADEMFDEIVDGVITQADSQPHNFWAQEDAAAISSMQHYFQEALETDNSAKAQRWARRLQAVTPGACNKQHGVVGYSNEYTNFLTRRGFEPRRQREILYCQPTAQIQYETNEILKNLYENEKQYGHFYDVNHLNACTEWAIKAANDVSCDRTARALPAFHLLDMAHEFQAAASKLGKSLATMKDAALRTSTVIEHLANRTVQLLGARTKEIIANPAPYAGELLLCATMPHVAFARLLYSAYVDRKQYVEFFSQIQSLANNNPQEACAQLAAFGVEFVFTGRLIKNTSQLSKHAKEFARFLREEARIVHAAAAGGIDVPIQTPLLKAVGNAAAEVKQNGSAAPQALKKVTRVYTETEIVIARKLTSAGESLTPELITLRENRFAQWLKEFKEPVKNCVGKQGQRQDFQISQAAANYDEIFNFIPKFFEGNLEGVFLNAAELKKSTVALFREIEAIGGKPEARIQLRFCSKPKGRNSYNPGEMAINFEYFELTEIAKGNFDHICKVNGHLPVIFSENFNQIEALIKQLTCAKYPKTGPLKK